MSVIPFRASAAYLVNYCYYLNTECVGRLSALYTLVHRNKAPLFTGPS